MGTKLVRTQLLSSIHASAGKVFGPMHEVGNDEKYRDWLHARFNVVSCMNMSNVELAAVAAELRKLLPAQAGSGSSNVPTGKQLGMLAGLFRKRGWNGLTDGRSVAFVKRTAKVDSMKYLSRRGASQCISGMKT
ncbi:MAG: DUF1018 domain-containing protein, partial [Gammaproteobacteria bacterium]|nr:DUF1018 domain-containing protein [Gammaproteobacteria bacterium]